MNIKPEYPRPNLVRDNWVNLNGEWDFEIDYSCSGEDREFYNRDSLSQKIIVPFCPESELSGINHKDFMPCVWYKKSINISAAQRKYETILHFGASDYLTKVYINGEKAMTHEGGYTPFSVNITKYIKEGENYITLCVYDDLRSKKQPSGKQSDRSYSFECLYSRTTGIWQTVWMETVHKAHIKSLRITTDISIPCVNAGIKTTAECIGKTARINALWEGRVVGSALTDITSDYTEVGIKLDEKHLWEVGKGRLYDLEITIEDGNEFFDKVLSYFGLRSVSVKGRKFLINGEPVFGKFVLDQGYYPLGIYTSKDENELKADITNALKLGFNGARLHQKVFEPRYLYWADKLGYLVFGEYASMGLDHTMPDNILRFLTQWTEAIKRDFNHPSIIGWCPFNETWDINGRRQCDDIISSVYYATKCIDPTRPVIDTSGNFHVVTDIYDIHDYEQDPEKFKLVHADIDKGIIRDYTQRNPLTANRQSYDGTSPVFVSEYGGIKWDADGEGKSWGYGEAPKTEDEFINRYKALTHSLLYNENVMGFCYTQLYDTEQEKNGLMTYDRKFKFKPEIIRKINMGM